MSRWLVTAFLVAGCATTPSAAVAPATAPAAGPTRAECCAQCSTAGQHDPTGMDISVKDCRSYGGAQYNAGPGVSEACLAYFASTPTTLGACWKEAPAK